jgi:tRNA G10  N-methylase Trm11
MKKMSRVKHSSILPPFFGVNSFLFAVSFLSVVPVAVDNRQ